MRLRFHRDEEGGDLHIHRHYVSESEVWEILNDPTEDWTSRKGTHIAFGTTDAGRLLKVIYVPDRGRRSAFVITAHDPGPGDRRRFRKRQKGK